MKQASATTVLNIPWNTDISAKLFHKFCPNYSLPNMTWITKKTLNPTSHCKFLTMCI